MLPETNTLAYFVVLSLTRKVYKIIHLVGNLKASKLEMRIFLPEKKKKYISSFVVRCKNPIFIFGAICLEPLTQLFLQLLI
jgi:hypothetical protein